MRADPRRLAHDGDVKMGDAPTSRTHTFYRECQEPIGRSAPPLRIGRGKMHTDIALGERTEKGIDERMKNDVGIRMPGQSARMGHAHATKHHVIAVAEAVNIEAEAGTHVAQGR